MRRNYNIILLYLSLLLLAGLDVSNGKGGGHGRDDHDQQNGRGHGHGSDKQHGGKKVNSCPQLETISRDITWGRVASNPTLPAKLIRMHFHDCFVRGCDASILLDSTGNTKAEKEAIPNRSLTGFDVIDDIKAKLEEECPGQISCADIIALAARDAVSFQFGRPLWPVAFGRKDGRISLESEATRDLPSPAADFKTLLSQFRSHGLDVTDLVALSGAHTIGVGHCVIIAKRLFNFTGIGDTDPSLDKNYADFLKKQCSNPPNPTTTVEMDPGSSLSFDTNYFVAINHKKGLFQSDAALLTNPEAARLSSNFENPNVFFPRFAQSMVKMGSIGVLTGKQGEIRKNCHFVN
ncbi:peroxidase 24-like [Ricinus communis]|uniref:Peroxidase n=1 Tax=Ricinus communis TaxID=3988 RepID=B9RSX7_RICCO|nr:peroxidase 24-like [Ricinus communis]EEF45460.1 Peroxidase 24 precursor, putative [Ricinus communis]|eukprot:XP_025012717.1 peroxidase 24-like [Ricinus communis]